MYLNISSRLKTWSQDFNDGFIKNQESYLYLPLNILSDAFTNASSNSATLLKDDYSLYFQFSNYTSCQIVHSYLDDLFMIMSTDITNSVYILLVCYGFLLMYNMISSISGLQSTLINFPKIEEYSNKEKKIN
jgi:hypothetical protein